MRSEYCSETRTVLVKIAVTSKSISLPVLITSIPFLLSLCFTDILLLVGQVSLPTVPTHQLLPGRTRQRHGVPLQYSYWSQVQSGEKYLLSISARGWNDDAFGTVALSVLRHDVVRPYGVPRCTNCREAQRALGSHVLVVGHCAPLSGLDLDPSLGTAVERAVKREVG